MTVRRSTPTILAFMAAMAWGGREGWALVHPLPDHRPNIILIVADDLGYGDLSYYGGRDLHTPHLDALAAGGTRFTDFHSSGPVCSPTRAGFLTGRYQQRAGIAEVLTVKGHRDQGLSPAEKTFPRLFQAAGYKTAIFGKWHLGYRPEFSPIRHGFDQFRGFHSGNVDYISHVDQSGIYDWWDGETPVEEEGYVTRLITRYAVEFIRANRKQPFLLYLAHAAPHYPYQRPGDAADRKVGADFPIRGSRADIPETYRVMIEELDLSVGAVMETLRDCDLEETTFVFFFSDNGATPVGSNGRLRGSKGSLWEGGHRVPAFATWPGVIPPGRICDEPVISLDLFPTILSAAGMDPPEDLALDGVDLFPYLYRNEALPDRALYWWFKDQKAVRKGDWKLLMPAGSEAENPLLFNLRRDPVEQHNRFSDNPDVAHELQRRLESWCEQILADRNRTTTGITN